MNDYDQPEIDAKNEYDPFDLPFLKKDDRGRIWNGEFDVTESPKRLLGVPTGEEEIKIIDYLVHRPLPKELLKWQVTPNYHPDSLDMDVWYEDILEFSYDGVWVDGEYFNPFFVYWMNVFVFPVPIIGSDGKPTTDFETSFAAYCNIDRYFFDYCWKAELTRQDIAIMGGRGVGKSYMINCIIDREFRLFEKSWSLISSTNEETTSEAWSKIEQGIEAIEKQHPALKYKLITDSHIKKLSGETIELPDGTSKMSGHLSLIEKITYGKNGGKTRGKRPTKQLFEEFAAFPPSHQKGSLGACIGESRGSWYVGSSLKKCTVMYSGTGGTVENDEAEGIFTEPEVNEILATNDWGETTGFFCPTHIKYAGTWEETGCPDIALATSLVNIRREKSKANPSSYLTLLQEFPMTVREVFTKKGTNLFNQDKIATQRINIIQGGDNTPKPGNGFLNWKKSPTGKIIGIEWDATPHGDISILEHPHWLSEAAQDNERSPIEGLYVGGCDSIDQGTGDSSYATDNKKGSELAILIKKRVLDGGYFRTTSNLYVAKYNKRSVNVRDDWDNALKLSYYFNAHVNIEYTKIGIVSHFRDNKMYHMLKKRPTINLTSGDPSKNTHLIGTTAGGTIIDHQDMKVASYIDSFYDQIWFMEMLDQLQNYNRDDRTKFDMVIAMGLCELADEDLMGKVAGIPAPKESSGLQTFGYYTDPNTGYKKYGVIPGKSNRQDEMSQILQSEADKFNKHGGVQWIDMTDPSNPVVNY